MRVRMGMRIMVRMKVPSFDILLFDSFTVGIFISTRGICAYIYLSIFLLFDIFTIRHFNHSTFLPFDIFTFRHFNFDIFAFDVFTFDVIQVNHIFFSITIHIYSEGNDH
jgi:hypothetical protein